MRNITSKISAVCFILFLFGMFNSKSYGIGYEKKDYSAEIDFAMVYAYKIPNIYTKSNENTINTIGVKAEYQYLDFNGYIDIYDALFLFEDRSYVFGQINNYLYGEINPRISFSKMTGFDLNYSILKDILISYNFTFDSKAILQHYMGIGVDFDIPLFSYLKTNIYARYNQKYYDRNEEQFDGYMLHVDYEVPIYKFRIGIELKYSGWLKYFFAGNPKGRINESNYSIQWKNMFKIGYKDFYIGYSYQYNNNFMEYTTREANSDEQTVGIYYTLKF